MLLPYVRSFLYNPIYILESERSNESNYFTEENKKMQTMNQLLI